MSFEEQSDFARQVADLNRYGQALNSCETVDEVASLTVEAVSLLFDFSYATFVGVEGTDARILTSTNPALSMGDAPSDAVAEAIETGKRVVVTGSEAGVGSGSDVTATLAVPGSIGDDVVVALVIRDTGIDDVGDGYVEPLEILAAHAATAVSNIRSRRQLERARTDLEKRKEMIELYDKLLRHDLGNDLQVISGFADALSRDLNGQQREYAEKIAAAAESSADLMERVGELVSTLEREEEPEPRPLQSVLTTVVSSVDDQYESLTVEYDPEAFDYSVYGGDLLDSVFTNIVSNAAVHNDGPVTVWLSATEQYPDEIVVSIADDGTGIPEEIREDLFEMGKKGPDSDGTGLGLGFVRALTESYGGTVAVSDSEHGGAEFRVTLERV
ncbi:histidine kinase [Halapricum sp. CBA1109]|uniref:sensor histidine kinase n=1 Tax=Halapricum sp. CBA1109 TaxID=2668068 RepID=UPI0012FCBD57|nr:GAF domain-containing sensor histidine kinase [Halapricum sp. CBA1109]MUV89110.1 histidine kinase [Halapricum sp. CBA1109]